MSQSVINGAAANVLNVAAMNEDYASTNTEQTNRDKSNSTAVTTINRSTIDNNNLLNDDNSIENFTIARDEDNAVINTFTNSEVRIAVTVEENLQGSIVQGPPAQGNPPSLNDTNLNLNHNVGWRNKTAQQSRPNSSNWSNNKSISVAQRSR